MGLKLRPYQVEGVDAVEAAWRRGMRRPAVVWPTGLGKTVGFSSLIARWLMRNPGKRALVLAHRTELIEQAARKLRDVAPDLRVGIIKANRNETLADVVVASVQTLRSESRRFMLRDVGLIVVDECHHATAETYVAILRHFGALENPDGRPGWSDAVAVGFTATMVRGDAKALGDIWQDVVHTMPIAGAIHAGWLARPRGLRVRVDDLDLSQVRRSRGDYSEGDLGAALEASLAPEVIAKAVTEHAEGRPTILFAPTVASATVIGDAVRDSGRSVGLVHGAQTMELRASILRDFSAGQIDFVTNCMVLTEGFDEPKTSCIVIARPTTNVGLHVQMIGRGLRPFPGKDDCLVLDVVGATQRHALVSPIELFGDDVLDGKVVEPADELDDLDEGEVTGLDGLELDDDNYHRGPVVAEEVDLFHGSTSAWLRTYGGVWFLAAGERYIAIVPGQGGWDVTAMHARTRGTGRWIIQGVADLSYAMAWAEGEVTPAEMTTARRERGWRKQAPSEKQVGTCGRMGIIVPPGASKGEVSNLMSTAFASARIDPPTRAWLNAQGRVGVS